MAVINQISLKDSGGTSSTLYDIGADAKNVTYDISTGNETIKAKIDSKANSVHTHVKADITDFAHEHGVATTATNGFLSAEDKAKINEIDNKANTSDVNTALADKLNISGGTISGALTVNTGLTLGDGNQVTKIIFSTTDLTPGTSNLATDTLYFVYV